MSNIRIIPVTTRKGLRAFVNFYYELYKGNKFAVPFLRFDEMNTLSKRKNPAFEFCEAQYFLAVDGEARIVGRVAAIINRRANEQWNKKQVRFGWFDFVDDLEVSQALLNAVEAWGRTKGMTECVGPLGFTDMDREGLLIEGFHHKSTMYINIIILIIRTTWKPCRSMRRIMTGWNIASRCLRKPRPSLPEQQR